MQRTFHEDDQGPLEACIVFALQRGSTTARGYAEGPAGTRVSATLTIAQGNDDGDSDNATKIVLRCARRSTVKGFAGAMRLTANVQVVVPHMPTLNDGRGKRALLPPSPKGGAWIWQSDAPCVEKVVHVPLLTSGTIAAYSAPNDSAYILAYVTFTCIEYNIDDKTDDPVPDHSTRLRGRHADTSPVSRNGWPTSYTQAEARRQLGVVGIRNQGATCYLNSLMQTLFHTRLFRRVLYEAPVTLTSSTTTGVKAGVYVASTERSGGVQMAAAATTTASASKLKDSVGGSS